MNKIVCIGAFAVNIDAIKNCAPPEKTSIDAKPVKIVLKPAACRRTPHARPIGM